MDKATKEIEVSAMKQDLGKGLRWLQNHTIGLFRPHAVGSANYFELVINEDGDLLQTIHLGSLGGHSENWVPSGKGVYKKFPDGISLSDFLKNPFALDEFVKSFDKKDKTVNIETTDGYYALTNSINNELGIDKDEIAVGMGFSLSGEDAPEYVTFKGITYKRGMMTNIPKQLASDFCSVRIYKRKV